MHNGRSIPIGCPAQTVEIRTKTSEYTAADRPILGGRSFMRPKRGTCACLWERLDTHVPKRDGIVVPTKSEVSARTAGTWMWLAIGGLFADGI
jgi:hypothetical protein